MKIVVSHLVFVLTIWVTVVLQKFSILKRGIGIEGEKIIETS